MTFADLLKTDYGMVGRIGSIETYDDGDIFITVHFDDGAVKRFNSVDLELVDNNLENVDV